MDADKESAPERRKSIRQLWHKWKHGRVDFHSGWTRWRSLVMRMVRRTHFAVCVCACGASLLLLRESLMVHVYIIVMIDRKMDERLKSSIDSFSLLFCSLLCLRRLVLNLLPHLTIIYNIRKLTFNFFLLLSSSSSSSSSLALTCHIVICCFVRHMWHIVAMIIYYSVLCHAEEQQQIET